MPVKTRPCAASPTSCPPIVAAALASWLSPDAGDQREAAIAKRLDRLSRQFERLERDQNIEIETLALFVRYCLTVSTAVTEAHQEAARAQGSWVPGLPVRIIVNRDMVLRPYQPLFFDRGTSQ
jgi:hypothetical protein